MIKVDFYAHVIRVLGVNCLNVRYIFSSQVVKGLPYLVFPASNILSSLWQAVSDNEEKTNI